MTGNWMRQTVQAWLVYRMSHSGWWLGAIVFCQQAPAFLLSPLAGVMADHRDRRKILIWVELISMAQALALAVLVWSGKVSLLEVALVAIVLGVSMPGGAVPPVGRGFLVAWATGPGQTFERWRAGRADLDSTIMLNSITIN